MKLHVAALWILGIMFVVAGIGHFVAMAQFAKMIPNDWPLKHEAVIVTGLVELGLAAGLMWPQTRKLAGVGIFLLLLLYTPIHIYDLMRYSPVIGSKTVAIIRLPIQAVLLYLASLIAWPRR